jgi:hypothetical protein
MQKKWVKIMNQTSTVTLKHLSHQKKETAQTYMLGIWLSYLTFPSDTVNQTPPKKKDRKLGVLYAKPS